MDVWNNEPLPDTTLLQSCLIATPHIAGYSRIGKRRALDMVFSSFCRHQGIKPAYVKQSKQWIYRPPQPQKEEDPLNYISDLLLRNYDLCRDSLMTKRALGYPAAAEERARTFIRLRREYSFRREGCEWQLSLLPAPYRQAAEAVLMDSSYI